MNIHSCFSYFAFLIDSFMLFIVHMSFTGLSIVDYLQACLDGMRLVVGVLQVADLTAAFDQYSGETYDYDSFIELIAPILVLVC